MAIPFPTNKGKRPGETMRVKTKKTRPFKWKLAMLPVTAFQMLSFSSVVFETGQPDIRLMYIFAGYIAMEWLYLIISRLVTKRTSFELEIIAFFLTGISLVIAGGINEELAYKQLAAAAAGLLVFILTILILRDPEFAMSLRIPAAFACVGILAANLLMAKTVNGALNWIELGPFSVQPSEFVKAAFVFIGAVTLDKLQSTQSLTKYVVFSVCCVGALFLMRDFGTALIFFFTFIVIAFMRSGDIRTIILVCAGALLGAMLIVYFRPYVATRFATYRHVWDFIDDSGFQQTRVLIYSASGGLFGLGLGKGKLREVFAASTDLVFGMLCEEWGLLLGVFILLAFLLLAVFAVKTARVSGSAFYAIACVAAAAMMLFQTALNVFGVTDLLPLTGVTLPFISRGGSSMICSWALLAFMKCGRFAGGEAKNRAY